MFFATDSLMLAGAVPWAAGLDSASATPYEIRINTADNCIYIRDADNSKWCLLGEVADNFGLTPETFQGVRNGGGMGRLLLGNETNLPTADNTTFDLFFAQDTCRVFIWTGTTWRKFLSLNFADMLNYEKYCIARHEVDYSGADKILRLDPETGKGNIDITGSPEKLCNFLIDVQELGDGHVLAFNAEKQKFVNLPNNELTRNDITYQGGVDNVGKMIRVGADGKIHADITGSANQIDGINIEAEEINDGEILQYSVIRNSFVPAEKDYFTEDSVTTTGEIGKLVHVSVDGKIHADIEGSATEIFNIPVDLRGIREGYVLAYSKGKFVPAKKDEIDDSTATTTGEANKFVKVGEDGKIHANITGSAQGLANVPLAISNLEDGQILTYHESTNTFRNEAKNSVGVGKSLILYDGEKLLGDYNGGETVKINLQEVLNQSSLSQDVAHLMRLTENLYLVLDVADLNPGGYDNLSGETFYGSTNDLDTTAVNISSVIQGDDSADVDSVSGLIEGAINRVIFYGGIPERFIEGRTKLIRSSGTISQGKISGVFLEHRQDLTSYNFALYFDGVKQENYSFAPISGQVIFTAPSGVIVSANYFYNWSAETFVEMTKAGTYPDRRNPNRATTQFTYNGTAGKIATLRLTLKRGTGNPKGFRLAHQAVLLVCSMNRTLEQWIEIFSKKVRKFERDKRFKLFYLPDKGFCELMPAEKIMVVGKGCGDGRFWKKFAEDMARRFGLKVCGTFCGRKEVLAWIRLFGFKIVYIEEKNGFKRYHCEGKNGEKGIVTECAYEHGGRTHYVTWEVKSDE